jgi:hypothetical protein
LTRSFLHYFCQTLEEGLSVLRADPGIECGTSLHLWWLLLVAVPSLLIWVIGLPAAAMLKLHVYSKEHSHNTADLDSGFNELVTLKSEVRAGALESAYTP